MIYGLSSKFQGHFLVNNDLSANLSDGFLDSSAFLDAVSRWKSRACLTPEGKRR